MADFIEIQWTTGNMDEARKVCRYVVQERYVACAQITPWIESIFMWNNQLDTAQETKVVFKSTMDHFDAIVKIIQENTSYEVPEITYRAIDGGNQSYMEWWEQSLSGKASAANEER